RAGKLNYQGKIEVGTQSIAFSVTTEVKEEGGGWVVTDNAKMPSGDMSDTSWIEKGSLVVTKRSIRQGPVTVDVEVKDNKATGSMNMCGQAKPIAAEIGGALFADGAGAYDALASLPLKDGYAVTFRNFDLMKQKVDLKQAKVIAAEKISVPAGSFDAF